MRCYEAQGEIIMKKYFLLSLCGLCLLASAGCSKSSGVMPWAPGVYSVTTDLDRTLFTSYADAERVAYDDAAAFCASKGQAVRVKNFLRSPARWFYSVKLIFACDPVEMPVTPEQGGRQKVDVEML